VPINSPHFYIVLAVYGVGHNAPGTADVVGFLPLTATNDSNNDNPGNGTGNSVLEALTWLIGYRNSL
jgi:hypothetical protein